MMFHSLRFEQLEERQMLSATAWTGGSGNWNQASHWTNGVPTATSDATIGPASAATITIPAGEADLAQSLTLGSNASLSMPGGGDPSNPTANSIASNAGFESPTVANSTTRPSTWGYWGSSYLSIQYAYAGLQSLAISGSDSGVTQQFAVTPGASYTASVNAMTPAANRLTGNINAQLQLLYYDSGGVQISPYSSPNQIVVLNGSSATGGPLSGSIGSEGWNHYFTTAVAPSNAATVRVQLSTYVGSGSFGGAVYFDAVQFGPAAGNASTLTVGSLSNNGTITLGATNKINVNGGFTQTSTGTLDVQLGGAPSTNSYGSVTITGAASLAGTFKSEVVYSYAPSTTDIFMPVTYSMKTGGFSSYVLPSGTGYQFAADASFTNVLLSSAPSAATTATVNAAASLRPVATNLKGVNLTWWDSSAVTTQTQQLATAAGLGVFRFPGGSSSDEFHFNVANNFNDSVAITIPQFVQFIASAGGSGMVTLDYGSGSPQEAAAELAYLQGSTSGTTTIGNGIEWNTTTSQWQTVNWGTSGTWAALRAATPLAQNDGLNFLRIGHAAPFTGIKYWEIGNEEYGSWETDHHGTVAPVNISTGSQHSPATYAAFAKQFADLAAPILMAAGLPSIVIGIDSGDPTGGSDSNWTQNVLTAGLGIGFVPAYISDHSYMQGPGGESDSFLLNKTVSNPSSVLDWTTRYALYQTLLTNALGSSQAANVQTMATEFNSVYTSPGKQSTSLVNGLFVANSLGSLLTSGYSGSMLWDLRNSWDTGNNNGNLLYGWRKGGDYGILGQSGLGNAPYSDTYVAYPSYYAMQLASKMIVAGGQVVTATSSYSDLNVYAVLQSNGNLDLLVINTNPAAAITNQFNLTGFQPTGAAQVWQYGKTEDAAQSLTTTGASALTHTSPALSLSGTNFSYTFPAYSMTVLDLTQAPSIAQWNSTVAGSWSAASWSNPGSGATVVPPGLRSNVVGDTAKFTSTGATISLNGSTPNLGGITFNSLTSYNIVIGSGGTIQLNNGASHAALTVSGGSHTIAAPIALTSSVDVLPAAGTTLTLSNSISGIGPSLTLNGPGKLVLNAANSFSGGTKILAGTLVLAKSGALPSGSSLTVSAGGILKFDASAAASPPADSLIAAAAAASSSPIGPQQKSDAAAQALKIVFSAFGI